MITIDNWQDYQNGNVHTWINLKDGTKIRAVNDNEDWKPEYPENIDMVISNYCTHGCEYCYAGCDSSGFHADLNWAGFDSLFNSLRPNTELAINMNSEPNPNLEEFLIRMRKQRIIVNLTLRQDDFEDDATRATIERWCNEELLHGVGISLMNPKASFIKLVKKNPNYVIHTIAGITPLCHYETLANNDLKILILGYKLTNRGDDYFADHEETVVTNIFTLSNQLHPLVNKFAVISFDNLAIEQLGIEEMLTPEEFEEFYMGDDGSFTMAIDLVNMTYSRNSTSNTLYRLDKNSTVDDIFANIQKEITRDKHTL